MKRAIILAGGRGERLRPLTEDRPKCMIEVLGSPILAYQLQWLASYGVERATIACGYMHELIQEQFGSGSKFGIKIDFSVEEKPLGRGGALKKAMLLDRQDDGAIVCLNGDHISNVSLKDLQAFHQQHDGAVTIVTAPLQSPYGVVQTLPNDTRVVGFQEKPILPYRINTGIYLMNSEIVDELPDNGDHEESTFPLLAKQSRLHAYNAECFWRTVDTMKDLKALNTELQGLLIGTLFHERQTADK